MDASRGNWRRPSRKTRLWQRRAEPMAEGTTRRQVWVARARSGIVRTTAAGGGRGGALAILLILVVAFFIATPDFLTANNVLNILRQYSDPAILAVGQTPLILSPRLAPSVASTAAL